MKELISIVNLVIITIDYSYITLILIKIKYVFTRVNLKNMLWFIGTAFTGTMILSNQ